MKRPIEFITASAGSGKTYRLVDIVSKEINGDECSPQNVVATTFTVAAASELREKLSSRLFSEGHHEKAILLESGLIGTVHSVCYDLLSRFALEASLSPEITILDDAQSQILLSQAFDQIFPDDGAEELDDLSNLSDLLGQRGKMSQNHNWRGDILTIVENARINGINPSELPSMATESWHEMQSALPSSTDEDLDQQLENTIRQALSELDPAPSQKNAQRCLYLLKESLEALEKKSITWDHWDRLTDPKPAAAERESLAPVSEVAERWVEHPRLHRHLKKYLKQTFSIAQNLYEKFIEIKQKKGVADYGDLEKETLTLLKLESVRNRLKETIDLLVVDEFQDTSPIQLALFMQLAECAKRTVWVGDIKQAIYGFRNADPELISNAVRDKTVVKSARLDHSWRSVPDLVFFVNELFTSVFARNLKLPEDEVRLAPKRKQNNASGPAIHITEIISNEFTRSTPQKLKRLTKRKRSATTADSIKAFLDSEHKIGDEEESDPHKKQRIVEARDIAVLTRTNGHAQAIAKELRIRGIDVSLACNGLLKTPEVRLAIACLRVVADPYDSLAVAEVMALEGNHLPEEWIPDRIGYNYDQNLKDPWGTSGDIKSQAICALVNAQTLPEARTASPRLLFELCYDIADLPKMISRWGPTQQRAEQRLLNLSGFRELIEKYQETMSTTACPVTLTGLFSWFEDIADDPKNRPQDKCPVDPDINAVYVGTYHGSKGLEWPVVFTTELDTETRTRLFALQAHNDQSQFTLSNPLANRNLRQWITPLPNKKNNLVKQALEQSKIGQAAMEKAISEDIRLLYVGFTRARDILVLIHDPATPCGWLNLADKEERLLGSQDTITLNDDTLPILNNSVVYEEYEYQSKPSGNVTYPAGSSIKTDRLPLTITASSQAPRETSVVTNTIEFGQGVHLSGQINDRDYGDAMHRIIAAEIRTPDHPNRIDRAARLLSHYQLEENITAQQAIETSDQYRNWIETTYCPHEQIAELPFDHITTEGQQVSGFIDHLLLTSNGPVIIDHKVYRGKRSELEKKALTFSGQLALYRQVIEAKYPDLPTPSLCLHFVTKGVLMEIKETS